MHTLQTLQILGLDPTSRSARRTIALVAENARWEHDRQRYFDGEVEPCINGRIIETGAYFGVDVAPIVDRVLAGQLEDGGWNCEAENGSLVSSIDTTINVLDGLAAFERATGGSPEAIEARRSPRLLPTGGRRTGSQGGGGRGAGALKAWARRSVVARSHPPGSRALRHREPLGDSKPLEHPACPAGPRLVGHPGLNA